MTFSSIGVEISAKCTCPDAASPNPPAQTHVRTHARTHTIQCFSVVLLQQKVQDILDRSQLSDLGRFRPNPTLASCGRCRKARKIDNTHPRDDFRSWLLRQRGEWVRTTPNHACVYGISRSSQSRHFRCVSSTRSSQSRHFRCVFSTRSFESRHFRRYFSTTGYFKSRRFRRVFSTRYFESIHFRRVLSTR